MQKIVNMTLKRKMSGKQASGQNIYEFDKEIYHSGYSDSVLRPYTCI